MAILSLPSSIGFARVRFFQVSNTKENASPLTGAVQTAEYPGARWGAEFELPPIPEEIAVDWQIFLVSLRGRAGRFYGYDPMRMTTRGSFAGTPVVDGAGQTGTSINLRGFTASATGVARKGDYFAYDTGTGDARQMHMVTADADADGSGNTTVSFEPPIRTSPADGASIITGPATCIMALDEDRVGWDLNSMLYGFKFNAIEVFKG